MVKLQHALKSRVLLKTQMAASTPRGLDQIVLKCSLVTGFSSKFPGAGAGQGPHFESQYTNPSKVLVDS